jgi:UTP--glucose-1-phosphate uridylyltransferase
MIDGQEHSCMQQMVDTFTYNNCSVIAVEEVDRDETEKYGIVSCTNFDQSKGAIEAIVEKPAPKDAPSNLAVVGRYILTPKIFDLLETTPRGAGGEIQLTDAIAAMIDEQKVLAYQYIGTRYDCGSKLGYLQATVEYGLKHPELGAAFRDYLDGLVAQMQVHSSKASNE